MAPIRESEDSVPPTFEVAHLPARRLTAIRDVTQEATSLKRGAWLLSDSSRWEDYRPIMKRLYIDEGRPLREVMEIMEAEFDVKATAKVFKGRFRAWGWRKYIRFDPDKDIATVQDAIQSKPPEDAGGRPAQKILLANGQLVDVSRLHRHLQRKRRQKDMPLTIRINQPDVFQQTEAIFYSARSHTISNYQGKLNGVGDAINLFATEEPLIGRWFRYTDEIQDLLKQQDLSGAIVQMRRAPDEVAAMIKAEPTVLLSNLFLYILKVGSYPATSHAESRHVKLIVKSLLQYVASLLVSGSAGVQISHPLQTIVKGLANAPESDLGELASRSWLVILQSCAQISGLDPSAAVSEGSLVKWLETGDQGEKDGLWFMEIIQGIIEGTLARLEAAFGTRDPRCVEALQRKVDIIVYTDMARRRDPHLDPRLEELYLQILDRGARGAQRTDALKFLAERRRARGGLDVGEDHTRLRLTPRDT